MEALGIPAVVSVLREFPEEGVEILSQTATILDYKREETVSVSRTETGVFANLFLRCSLSCRPSSFGCLSHIAGCCRENCSNVQEEPVMLPLHYNVRPQVGPRELI